MKVKFRHSETAKEHTVLATVGDFHILDYHPMNWSSDCHVAVKKSAVDVVPEKKYYYAGQKFLVGRNRKECLLAYTGSGLQLIDIKEGNRWSDVIIQVTLTAGVTQEQLERMAGKDTPVILSCC
jgi:hypothetical protein